MLLLRFRRSRLRLRSHSTSSGQAGSPQAGLGTGRTLALLYRPVAPGAGTLKVPFSSPWRTITLDRVEDVSAQVELAGTNGNFEISIPLGTLGLSAQAGTRIKGDFGILRGNGFQTLQRAYWCNTATAITADVPSEAELTPRLWGLWEFR